MQLSPQVCSSKYEAVLLIVCPINLVISFYIHKKSNKVKSLYNLWKCSIVRVFFLWRCTCTTGKINHDKNVMINSFEQTSFLVSFFKRFIHSLRWCLLISEKSEYYSCGHFDMSCSKVKVYCHINLSGRCLWYISRKHSFRFLKPP